jgi:hypothetical protein
LHAPVDGSAIAGKFPESTDAQSGKAPTMARAFG